MIENPKEAAGRKKTPLHLVPPEAKRLTALALAHGAGKYGAWNWRDAGVEMTTYLAAIERHCDALRDGEDIDPESGLHHVAHVLAGASILADAIARGMVHDDRWKAK